MTLPHCTEMTQCQQKVTVLQSTAAACAREKKKKGRVPSFRLPSYLSAGFFSSLQTPIIPIRTEHRHSKSFTETGTGSSIFTALRLDCAVEPSTANASSASRYARHLHTTRANAAASANKPVSLDPASTTLHASGQSESLFEETPRFDWMLLVDGWV